MRTIAISNMLKYNLKNGWSRNAMANPPPPPPGTPEVGGLTSIQALEIVRGCRGLNLVGCDLVEVSVFIIITIIMISITISSSSSSSSSSSIQQQ